MNESTLHRYACGSESIDRPSRNLFPISCVVVFQKPAHILGVSTFDDSLPHRSHESKHVSDVVMREERASQALTFLKLHPQKGAAVIRCRAIAAYDSARSTVASLLKRTVIVCKCS